MMEISSYEDVDRRRFLEIILRGPNLQTLSLQIRPRMLFGTHACRSRLQSGILSPSLSMPALITPFLSLANLDLQATDMPKLTYVNLYPFRQPPHLPSAAPQLLPFLKAQLRFVKL
jgi:hypothetical protein